MRQLHTAHFGTVEYQEDSVLDFPQGLPAFEDETRFLLIEQPATAPVIFLQSLQSPALAFITLPVLLVDPSYQLAVPAEDLQILALPEDRQPVIGTEVLCLAIATVTPGFPPTANLMAPVVVNLAARRAVQTIQPNVPYSHQQPLFPPGQEATPCS